MSRKIVITGANGFIGSNLVKLALEKGYDVYPIVREGSSPRLLSELETEIYRTDFLSYQRLNRSFKQIGNDVDLFIHCAGVTEARNTDEFQRGNVQVTENLLKTIKVSGIGIKKFVLLSSLAARGPGLEKEETGDDPISDYGSSKLQAESILRDHDLPSLIVRPTAVYGPGDLAFLELVKLLKLRLSIMLGNPESKLTFIHVEDLCELIMQSNLFSDPRIYAYDGKTYTQRQTLKAFKEAMDIRSSLTVKVPSKFFLDLTRLLNGASLALTGRTWKYTPEKAKELIAEDWSIGQNNELLKIEPKHSLNSGVSQTVEWYKEKGWI